MIIIGCDFHTRFQQIAIVDSPTGEIIERRLDHESGEAKKFYEAIPTSARVGMEATGHAHWFERRLAGQGHELLACDAAQIRAGQNFIYVHLNRVIKKYDLDMLYIAVPGTAARRWRAILTPKAPTVRFIRTSARTKPG